MYTIWGVFLQIIAALSGLFAIVSFFYKPEKLKLQTKIIILLCAALVFALGYIINSQLPPPATPALQNEPASSAAAGSVATSSEPADNSEPASFQGVTSSSSAVSSAPLQPQPGPSSSQTQQSTSHSDVSVEITYVPPVGEPNAEEYVVEGNVKGFDSAKHLLLVFAMGANGDYYVKPYQNAPLSVVDSNGKFKTNVNTDKEGNDFDVPSYCAIVVLGKDFPDPQTVTYDEALANSIASNYRVRK